MSDPTPEEQRAASSPGQAHGEQPRTPAFRRSGSWEVSPGGSLPQLSNFATQDVLSRIDNGVIHFDPPGVNERDASGAFELNGTFYSHGELYFLKVHTGNAEVKTVNLKPVQSSTARSRSPPTVPRRSLREAISAETVDSDSSSI